MRKTLLVGGFAALAFAASSGLALAQQAPARGMRADVDGDSRISQAEFVGQRVQRLIAADIDHDGTVSADERRASRQAHMAGRADAHFDRLDADDNGAVSRAEFDAVREARQEARAGRGVRPQHARDGSGRGHRGMRRHQAAGPVVIADAQTRSEQAFARLDADHDGFVTAAEGRAGRAAMREHHRERIRERRAARPASPQASASE